MSARSISDILAELRRFLPASTLAALPILAGAAAASSLAEQTQSDLADNLEYGTAVRKWLDLLAEGMGLRRTAGEADVSLLGRMRNVPDAVTRPAILAAVNALLATYTADEAVMVEWFDGPYLDLAYLDDPHMPLSFGPNAFSLIVPNVGDGSEGGSYVDSSFLDDNYLGSGPIHPIYAAIFSLVETMRAAGVRWALVIDQT